MQLIDSQTYLNLARAYSGECQAQNRYKFIEYGARMQDYTCLAQVIDQVVYNEFNHARMLYTHIQKASKQNIENINIEGGTPFREKWNLVENLNFAAQDEADEVKLYKEFSKVAEKEGFKDIAAFFSGIGKIEAIHQKLFSELYTQLSDGSMYKKDKKVKWHCTGCGHEDVALEAWEICPICGAKQGAVALHLKNCC